MALLCQEGSMLQAVSGQKNDVLVAIGNAAQAFAENNAAVQQKMTEAYPDAGEREQARQQIVSGLNEAYLQASGSHTDAKWFTPRGALAGLAQSAMNDRAQKMPAAAAAVGASAEAVAALAPLEQFGPLDPGWIECVVDGFQTLFAGKAAFVQHEALSDFLHPMKDQVTIALVSDWGASNEAAALVAAQIRKAQPDIVIHLGDIYYAGQKNEALAMLKGWPLAIAAGNSFALNGNHEMFSGGRAYFETVLPAFGQKASYFGLRNASWQILAFDSAYIEQRLLPPADAAKVDARLESQWNWLADKMKNSGLPTILLCHHQPVSAFAQENSDAATLRSDFQQFTAAAGRGVFGWFFGHEHRCTIYDDANIPYYARLIGNGCIPHSPPPANQKPEPGCYSFSRMNTRAKANGDAVSGFALLKFDGGQIDIRYIDEDGALFFEEIWQAPLANAGN
jgi:hypothetical protein